MKRPLPPIANEIFELVYYKADFKKAVQLFEKVAGPVEKMYSRFSIASFLFWFAEDDKVAEHLEEFKKESETLSDPFDRFYALYSYYSLGRFYFAGGNNPSLDEKVGREYSKKAIELIEVNSGLISQTDLWMKTLFEAFKWYHLSYSSTDENLKYSYILKSIEKFTNVPIDGPQIKYYGTQGPIVNFYLKQGKIKEAKQVFYEMNDMPQRNYWTDSIRDSNLAYLEFLSGNIDKAIALRSDSIVSAKEHGFTWGMYRDMSQLANYLTANGNLDEAEKLHIESLGYRKQHSNPVEAIMGYYYLIRLLTIIFQITNDNSSLNKAKEYCSQMKLLMDKYPTNITVNNFSKISGALIGKFGRLKDRANAQEIFEEMIVHYPNFYDFQLDLLELLFEEAQLSSDSKIIDQIDTLINGLSSIGLFTSNTAPSRYIQLQIFISRYEMFIRGNIDQAMTILQDAQEKIKSLNLKLLSNQINIEIDSINKKVKQWEFRNLSLQDRLKKGDIDKYIKNALLVISDDH